MLFRHTWFCLRSASSPFIQFKRKSSNYYDVLKLQQSCTTKDIRDAFIALSKQNHPDRHLNDPSMHERFVRINEAYSVLINPSKRRAYDISLEHSRKLQPPSDAFRHRERSSSYTTVETTSPHYTSYTSGFKDNSFWEYRDKSHDIKFQDESYYGVKGVKRASNGTILTIILVFTIFGVLVQWVLLTKMFEASNEMMNEKDRRLLETYNRVRAMATQRDNKETLAYLLEAAKEAEKLEIERIKKPSPSVISIAPVEEVIEDSVSDELIDEPFLTEETQPSSPTPPYKRDVIVKNLVPEPL